MGRLSTTKKISNALVKLVEIFHNRVHFPPNQLFLSVANIKDKKYRECQFSSGKQRKDISYPLASGKLLHPFPKICFRTKLQTQPCSKCSTKFHARVLTKERVYNKKDNWSRY